MPISKYVYRLHLKHLTSSPYEFWMIVLVVVASLLRYILISYNWPVTNSDEATMGLMAKHIVEFGEHPIFYYGQAYMGPIEAYVAALLIPFFGASTFTLRLGLLLFFACFLICMYFLTRLLYSRQLALFTVGLLSLGSGDMLLHQLRGIGGYPEIVGLGALLFWLASSLALSYDSSSRVTTRRRWLLYGFYGFVAGFSVWTDQLILPWIATSGLLLALFCRSELRKWGAISLLVGFVLGAAPLIFYNLGAAPGENSLAVLFGLQHAGAAEMAAQHISRVRQLVGSLLYALPAITGIRPLCAVEVLPLFGPTSQQTYRCVAWQGGWALGYVALWSCAAFLAGSQIWRQCRRNGTQAVERAEEHSVIVHSARLLLLVSAALTLISYTISPPAALVPGPTSRYLVCMQIATPALLWPLWSGLRTLQQSESKRARLAHLIRAALLLFIVCIFLFGTIQTVEDIPSAQATYQQEESLIHDLLHIGATRIYTDYWTCNRLILQSNEHIICGNLDASLQSGQDRYLPYRESVRRASSSTYVFLHDAPQIVSIEERLQQGKIRYQRYSFDGYIIYHTQIPLS